jgi:PII-like signaling protein
MNGCSTRRARSAFPAAPRFAPSAGYGRHGVHEDSFFELAGKLPETVEFVADAARIQALVKRVGEAGLKLVYVTHPVAMGVTGA